MKKDVWYNAVPALADVAKVAHDSSAHIANARLRMNTVGLRGIREKLGDSRRLGNAGAEYQVGAAAFIDRKDIQPKRRIRVGVQAHVAGRS